MRLNVKQTQALDFLEDQVTTEVLYGGGAGGGKSILGGYWLAKSCLKYKGSRWLMGRANLKTLKETTLQSFFKVCALQGLKAGTHYKYVDNPKNIIEFFNGSQILLKDLFAYPSDPNFDELGSLEITGGFIDEANQVSEKAKNIVSSRIRHNLGEYGIIPKLLMACNPAKNWTYQQFYLPSRDGTIKDYRRFIQALVDDNPDIDKHYRENLLKLDKASKERLLFGNWEYDDDPATLIEFDKILDCFTNDFVEKGDRFITADIARFGADTTVIGIWEGFRVKLLQFKGLSVTETSDKIRALARLYKVPNSQIVADEDGVGGGVVDILGCEGFVNNSSPLDNPITREDENFNNLKSQCYFKLADRINRSQLYIHEVPVEMRASIIEELEQVKQHNMDKDGKRQVVPKDKVKEVIGRSPDFSDTLMMREYFELAPRRTWSVV